MLSLLPQASLAAWVGPETASPVSTRWTSCPCSSRRAVGLAPAQRAGMLVASRGQEALNRQGMDDGSDRRSLPRSRARRVLLKLALGLGLGFPFIEPVRGQDADPRKARPQRGDRFVFRGGTREGQIVTLADLPKGGPPVTAYPIDPSTRIVRNDSRLNQVLLIRLDPADLADETRARGAQGVVAYRPCARTPAAISGTGSPRPGRSSVRAISPRSTSRMEPVSWTARPLGGFPRCPCAWSRESRPPPAVS